MSDKAEIQGWVCLPLDTTCLKLTSLPGVLGSSQFYVASSSLKFSLTLFQSPWKGHFRI